MFGRSKNFPHFQKTNFNTRFPPKIVPRLRDAELNYLIDLLAAFMAPGIVYILMYTSSPIIDISR